jgi:hypothetical protein
LPSSLGRAQWAARFLYLSATADGLELLQSLFGLASSDAHASAIYGLVEGVQGLLALVSFFGAAICFLRWEHRVVKNTLAMGLAPGVTPGAAVGWWFVPFANLSKPYRVIRDLLNQLDAGMAQRTPLAGWWAAFLTANIVGNLQARFAFDDNDAYNPTTLVLGIVSSLAGIIGALLCIRVVRAVQAAADARRVNHI